ncbi:MAG: FtsQ-type POTRA domain-containing protein [Myxococcota bacterium]
MSTLLSVVKVSLTVGISVAAGVGAYELTREGQYLIVNKVTVQGHSRIPTEELLEYASVPQGISLYSVRPDVIQRAVMRHPDVATAMVRRVPPDEIVITVSEHAPMATVALNSGVYLVDREGRTFRRAFGGEALDLPVVTGIPREWFNTEAERAGRMLQLALRGQQAHLAAGRPATELTEIQVDEAAGLTLRLGDPGMEVDLGHDGFAEKFQRLAVLEKVLKARKQEASRVFLDNARHPERVALRLREPELALSEPTTGNGRLTGSP